MKNKKIKVIYHVWSPDDDNTNWFDLNSKKAYQYYRKQIKKHPLTSWRFAKEDINTDWFNEYGNDSTNEEYLDSYNPII